MHGLAINGGKSAIARALVTEWTNPSETIIQVPRGADMPLTALRYLFCQGIMYAKRSPDQSADEQVESFHANFSWIANQCDRILDTNAHARICVLGSESGFVGSFDDTYAAAKMCLHDYVGNKKLRTPDQQLICVAPSIVADAGMTLRRKDADVLARKIREHPKGRFLLANEVAGLIHHVLYVDRGYLSGVTIRMNGGAHCGHTQGSTNSDAAPRDRAG